MIKLMMVVFVVLSLKTYADEYHVDKSKKNVVKFISDAPIEEFEGITDKIDGYFMGNPSDLTKKSEMYFEVQLNTIKTGIGLRDRHMQENYLHTDKYPITHFTGSVIDAKKKTNGFDVIVEGDIFIHGVKKKIKTSGEMIKTSNGYKVSVNFFIALSDYNVKIPSLMFQKINENMEIVLDFYLMNLTK